MRLLVLGGTLFLSRAVAESALGRGHDVTCACRGRSGSVPTGATHLPWDRAEDAPPGLAVDGWDAVVDVARRPSWVARAVDALPGAHWVFVSTMSVYADHSRPGGTVDTTPLLEPLVTDEDPMTSPEVYGGMKVACEQLVAGRTSSHTVVRPGLVVGPGDPSGRFAYWPERLDRARSGEEVLAPPADDPVQLIDVRDLAAWLVTCAERRLGGTFDANGTSVPRHELLAGVAEGVGSDPSWTFATDEFLLAHDVAPWSGPRSLPLWVPGEEWRGFMAQDVSAAHAEGLTCRPVAETARDTLAWLRTTPDAPLTGLTPAEEREVLAAWHARLT